MPSYKILLIGSAHPLRGGIATFNEQLAKTFISEGHQVEILSFSLQYPSFLFPGTSQYTQEPAPKGIVIHSQINSINPFNWLKVGFAYQKKQYDLIVVRFWLPFMAPSLGTVVRLIKRGSNEQTPLIIVADNVIPHEKRMGDRWFTKYLFSAADGFVVMARALLKDIDRFVTDKPKVYTPHPIYDNYGESISKSLAFERLGIAADKPLLLFFGLIRPYKGLDLLLEAIGELKKRRGEVPFRLLVAGEPYEPLDRYEAIIAQYGLGEEVIWHAHFIPSEQVNVYFCAASLVTQPYKTATQSGVSQIAYHFERPMLVTAVGGLAEIVPNGKIGYVVQPDSEEIAKAIEDFFEHDREQAMTAHIPEEKAKFAWTIFVDKLLTVARLKAHD